VGDGTGGKTTSIWWARSYLQAKEDAVRDVASTTAPRQKKMAVVQQLQLEMLNHFFNASNRVTKISL
jgi:hypothetical protein